MAAVRALDETITARMDNYDAAQLPADIGVLTSKGNDFAATVATALDDDIADACRREQDEAISQVLVHVVNEELDRYEANNRALTPASLIANVAIDSLCRVALANQTITLNVEATTYCGHHAG